jgi:hypothetical protein
VPLDPAVALPGYWMLFAIQGGVPSVAETCWSRANEGTKGKSLNVSS